MTPWQNGLAYVLTAALAIAICVSIYRGRRSARFSNMTEEEFQSEAARSRLLSAGMLAIQKIVDADHKIEYVQQQDKHVEAEGADAGEPLESRRK